MAKELIIVDTCVLIRAFRKDREASLILQKSQLKIAISAITTMELYFGAKTVAKKNIVKQLVDSYYSITLSPAISQKAVQLMHDYVSGNRNISVPDCLIAATSIITGFPLLTFNTKDFEFIEGLQLIKRPF
jgi:predicted nucleic acid-binding protein